MKPLARQRQRGFTALELLVVLAIAAVIAGIAVPALGNVVSNARRIAAVNGLVAAIAFARSAAQTHNKTVVLCRAPAGSHCRNEGSRWIVLLRADNAPADDVPADVPGRTQTAAQRTLRVVTSRYTGHVISNRARFEFRPFPQGNTNGTISFCDPRGATQHRAIVIARSGRARVVRPSSEHIVTACAPP